MIDVIFGQLAQGMQQATSMVVSRQNTLDRIEADMIRTAVQIQANQQNAADDRFFREHLSDKKAAQDFTAQEFLQARRLEHEEQRDELHLVDQWLRQKDQQDFQMRLAAFNAEQQRQIERFRQESENQRQEKRMSFDMFMFEKKRQLEQDLKAYDRETQRLAMLWSLRNLMVNADYQRMRDAHPLVMDMKITLNLYAQPSPDHAPVPPLVIYMPPALEFERVASNIPQEQRLIQQQWAFLETRLTQSLNDMFETHYAQESCRPVHFFGNAYKTKALRGNAAIRTLFDTHGMIPTIVIETEADVNQLNMYAAWWETGYAQAKRRKFLTVALPDAAAPNLAFAEAVGACQSILAGLLTDSYYLRHYQTLPELPRILPELLRPVTDERQKQQVINMAVAHYQKLYESLAPELATWVPDLAAEFARSLIDANYAALANEQLQFALRAWLNVKGQSIEDAAPLQQLLARIEEVFTTSDISFIETANACLAKLGERQITTAQLERRAKMEREQALEREIAELKRQLEEEKALRQQEKEMNEKESISQITWEYTDFEDLHTQYYYDLDDSIPGYEEYVGHPNYKWSKKFELEYKRRHLDNDCNQHLRESFEFFWVLNNASKDGWEFFNNLQNIMVFRRLKPNTKGQQTEE